jgi:hypothetical protein
MPSMPVPSLKQCLHTGAEWITLRQTRLSFKDRLTRIILRTPDSHLHVSLIHLSSFGSIAMAPRPHPSLPDEAEFLLRRILALPRNVKSLLVRRVTESLRDEVRDQARYVGSLRGKGLR